MSNIYKLLDDAVGYSDAVELSGVAREFTFVVTKNPSLVGGYCTLQGSVDGVHWYSLGTSIDAGAVNPSDGQYQQASAASLPNSGSPNPFYAKYLRAYGEKSSGAGGYTAYVVVPAVH